MAVHPDLQALLATPFANMLFNLTENFPLLREMMAAAKLAESDLPRVFAVEERSIPGPLEAIPVRIYSPEGAGPFPLLMFFHGGGFVLGSLDSHELICRTIVNATGYKVISVDYRLAPEHPFPAAPEDCYAATQWAAQHAGELNIDAQRIAVCGDSAGGNLAVVVALMARDRGGPHIAKQVLIYPITDYFSQSQTTVYVSYRENAEGYMLTAQAMNDFWNLYLPDSSECANPYAAPIRANDLTRLPPTLIITAQYDPLRDEGIQFLARLRAAGIAVTHEHFDDMIHGFWGLTESVSRDATKIIADFLRAK